MAEATTTEHETQQIEQANARDRTPVVFIHGLWLLPSSWDRWATLFEEAGYAPLTPGWPDDPETVEQAKEHPEVFANKTVGQVADHFAEVIGKLNRKPAVMGHSFGGLLTQIIAGRGLSRRPWRSARPRSAGAAAPDLGAEGGLARSANPANRQPRCAAHVRAVPLRLRQRGDRGRGQAAVRQLRGARPRRAAVPAASANLNPWTEAKVRTRTPIAGRS